MKDLALDYYQNGYGCSQCILKASETKYKIGIDKNSYRMAGTLNAGMGIGGMCSVLIACVMVLGLLFDEETAKRYRITFLSEFHQRYGGMDCSRLAASRRSGVDCSGVVRDAAGLLEAIIESAYGRK